MMMRSQEQRKHSVIQRRRERTEEQMVELNGWVKKKDERAREKRERWKLLSGSLLPLQAEADSGR